MKKKTIFDRNGYGTTIGYEGKIALSDWDGDTLVNCPTKEDLKHQAERLIFDFWLCVDEDGREQIMANSYGLPPVRSTAPPSQRARTLSSFNDNLRTKHCGTWVMRHTVGMFITSGLWCDCPDVVSCPLPKGSIRRLIGRELTWKDDPVLLQRDQFTKKKSWWRKMWEKVKGEG